MFSGARFIHDLPNQNPRLRSCKWSVANFATNGTNKFKSKLVLELRQQDAMSFKRTANAFPDLTRLSNL